MPNTNFPEVVLAFLKDRLVEKHVHRVGMCHLVEKADLSDGLENHLRAALLIGCKKDAFGWLRMTLGPVKNSKVPEARWIQSSADWNQHPLNAGLFRSSAYNVFGQPLVASAKKFKQDKLPESPTRTMFEGLDQSSLERVRDEPGTTIWQPVQNGHQCLEGNARMHALALGLVRDVVKDADVKRWSMWVPDT